MFFYLLLTNLICLRQGLLYNLCFFADLTSSSNSGSRFLIPVYGCFREGASMSAILYRQRPLCAAVYDSVQSWRFGRRHEVACR